MKVRIPCSVIVLGCTAALVVSAPASADLFMQADGIQGESNAQGFEGAIELDSLQLGVGRQSNKPASFSDSQAAPATRW